MPDAIGNDPGAESPARGAGQQGKENECPQPSAPGASPSATGERIRRRLPELVALDRWIVRDAAKVPLHPGTLIKADIYTPDRDIWRSFDDALRTWAAKPKSVAGLGLVMWNVHVDHPELRLVGIDLDKAFDVLDALKPWAQRIVDAAGPCYWERSPSGIGLRGFMRGAIAAELNESFNAPKENPYALDSGGIELYDGRGKRYLTVTGVRYAPA